MPIYKITNSKASSIPFLRDGFGNEFKLRDFFAENLEALLWVKFLEKEYPTDGGRMDTIGIDENGSPVIIEYKWKENEEVLSQGLFYLDWLMRNKKHFELLVKNKLHWEIEVNWNDPRVILVAQWFSRYIESAVQQIEHVELKTYALYWDGIIHIENIYWGKQKKLKKEKGDESKEMDILKEQVVSYDLSYHKKATTEILWGKYEELRDRLLSLPEVEELTLKVWITYRTTKSFVRFEFRKKSIMILVREASYQEDCNSIVEDIAFFEWGYKGKILLTESSDTDLIFKIIIASYNSTL